MRTQSILALAVSLLFAGALAAETPSELRVQPESVEIYAGAAQQLLVTSVADKEIDRTHETEYRVSNPEVIRVDSTGLIRARREGEAVVEARRGNQTRSVRVKVSPAAAAPPVRFAVDVTPVFTKRGCNSGGCHGKATGQNGFKLSLLGFEPSPDYRALVHAARGRRLFPADPDRSLLLLKATGRLPHGGGARLDMDSDDYRVLRQWIARGAAAPQASDPVLERLELAPGRRVLARNARQQLLVTAHYSDGASRDVTRQAVYQSNEAALAAVTPDGAVSTNSADGLFSIMVRFGGKIATFHGAIPRPSDAQQTKRVAARLAELEQKLRSPVDRRLLEQWQRLGVTPSPEADDATFIRRVSIDICGTLPTREEVDRYVADKSANKRERLINRLLERPEYASYFALKWADILQNRGAGYSTGKQRPGTALFAGWIRDSLAANKPYDRFVREILTASGSQNENPPTVWYRTVRTTPDYVESVAQAFLGVRIQCAQCHHHPFERWSQADYYGLAAVFARVGRKGGFADAEVPTNEVIYLRDGGEVRHPRTGAIVKPRALGGPVFRLTPYDDPRASLAKWMTAPDNPFFARTMANRMWAHFLGRGVIHPIDDSRSTNPPSNPELIDALSREFAASGYDIKQLIRIICNSHAYRLVSAPNEFNRSDSQSFARYYPRRLTAEVLLDALSQTLEAPTAFGGGPGSFPVGTRAIELPDENVRVHFLDVFGRPARTSACECERIDDPALGQALELVNSAEIQRKLTAKDGYVAKLIANKLAHRENVTDIFLRVFARPPRAEEMKIAENFLKGHKDRGEAYRSLIWSLLVTNEFLFNH